MMSHTVTGGVEFNGLRISTTPSGLGPQIAVVHTAAFADEVEATTPDIKIAEATTNTEIFFFISCPSCRGLRLVHLLKVKIL